MTWWRGPFRRRSYEEELDKELRLHLDLHTSDLIARGLDPEEGRRQARVALGGPEQVKELCRDELRTRWLADLVQDLRYGVRVLAKRPGFTAVAALALALGIGVNAAILSAVNGFVLRPMSVADPENLVSVYWGRSAEREVWGPLSYANFTDLRERSASFSKLCAWSQLAVNVSSVDGRGDADAEHADVLWGEIVSEDYFDVMGVRPAIGRGFAPEEHRAPDEQPVVILSHTLWQRQFDADPAIVGRTAYLNGRPFTVVGVMPESFIGSMYGLRAGFWVPAMMSETLGRRADWRTDRTYTAFSAFGRLKPGVTTEQAEADLNSVAASLADTYPTENADTKVQVATEVESRYGAATKILRSAGWLAVCLSGLVLLLACANVANLMLARATSRAGEIGTRLAIGAGRGRIVRQLLTESVMLAMLGGALGLALAYWGASVIRSTVPPIPYPIDFDFAPDPFVLRWLIVTSVLSGVIFGMAPAVLASRTNLMGVIKGAAVQSHRGRRRWNLRSALVVAQVTISIVVLICAGLFVRSLGNTRRVDPGFRTENLVTMMVDVGLAGYDKEAGRRFYRELRQRLDAQPGVRAVAVASEMPLMVDRQSRGPIVREGEEDPPPNQGVHSECSIVSPGYFETLRTPLVSGRDFTDRDDSGAPGVVIVNRELARRFYGDEASAMGRRIRFAAGTPMLEIVGIAEDGKYESLYEDPQPYMFLPVAQNERARLTLLVSAESDEAARAVPATVRREIAQLDPRLPIFGIVKGEDNLSLAFWGPRVAAGVATTFGLLALVLATTGLYSVMTYSVSQRKREIGIRMALGAGLRDVLRLVVRQGMRMALLGVALGIVGALALTRVLASLLLGVGTTDAVTYVGVTVLLVAVAFLACYVPARRATRVDPLMALRQD